MTRVEKTIVEITAAETQEEEKKRTGETNTEEEERNQSVGHIPYESWIKRRKRERELEAEAKATIEGARKIKRNARRRS